MGIRILGELRRVSVRRLESQGRSNLPVDETHPSRMPSPMLRPMPKTQSRFQLQSEVSSLSRTEKACVCAYSSKTVSGSWFVWMEMTYHKYHSCG